MKTLALICTIVLLLLWWPHSTYLSNPAIMYVDETAAPWTPIHAVLMASALVCVAALWFLAVRSRGQS
jgi:hypothetical protein